MEMLAKAGFNTRNLFIVATSLCIGVGVTEVEGFFSGLPSIVGEIFCSNMVAGVFIIALILSWVLPKDMEQKSVD